VLVSALAERGALDEAAGLLGTRRPATYDAALRHARARLALAAGDYERAAEDAKEAGRRHVAHGQANPAWSSWRATLALALAHAGRSTEAVAVADEAVALAAAFGAPTAHAIALHARCVSETDLERRAERAAAALALPAGPSALVRVRLQVELGSALVRLGSRVEARDVLRPAYAAADAAGAASLAAQARRALVASGLRPRGAATEGAAALTPRQRQICDLAAAGRSNREIAQALFLSVKTVETHLAAAYAKLGVAGRPALVAALAA
jgi:DNA-binding CsgD family transcriptional regulator